MFWLINHRDTPFFEVTKKEQYDAIERLISQGTLKSGYYFVLILSILITTPGLLLNNVAVIIGGMILAPLMVPLLSLSLSVVSGSGIGCLRSLRILVISVLLTLLTSAGLTLILSNIYDVVSWIPDQITPGVYVFIAFCSGIAGALAWVKENLAPAIAGVAVAVSLLPPLCAAGIGLALQEFDLLKNSMVLFSANLVGMFMAAFLVFWFLGFLHAGKVEKKVIEEKVETN
jgi:uncharacterized hydrophobic protein (TIGR00271 family)